MLSVINQSIDQLVGLLVSQSFNCFVLEAFSKQLISRDCFWRPSTHVALALVTLSIRV